MGKQQRSEKELKICCWWNFLKKLFKNKGRKKINYNLNILRNGGKRKK